MTDTIVALSSGAPPSAIGVIRLSGPHALAAATAIAGKLPPSREARVRALRYESRLLDRALVILFPAAQSVTGEDLVEFHVHGGRAVIRAVEAALVAQNDVRHAEPGEFTRRALSNGRIDLIDAEALGDLLTAETEAQHRAAIQLGSGKLRREIDQMQALLLQAAAKVELTLDFADEEDAGTDADLIEDAKRVVADLIGRIDRWTAQPTTEQLRQGFRIVLAGPPNAGKSTLLNSLVDREAAIVSDIAGTTRDRIEVSVTREGLPFTVVDTAGLTDTTTDVIERIGVDRARQAASEADVVLWLDDAPSPYADAVLVHAKSDEPGRLVTPEGRIPVSAHQGFGIDLLWSTIVTRIQDQLPPLDGMAINERQNVLLLQCSAFLKEAVAETDPVLIAHSLGQANAVLDATTGQGGTEAMLDTLFTGFCIGK